MDLMKGRQVPEHIRLAEKGGTVMHSCCCTAGGILIEGGDLFKHFCLGRVCICAEMSTCPAHPPRLIARTAACRETYNTRRRVLPPKAGMLRSDPVSCCRLSRCSSSNPKEDATATPGLHGRYPRLLKLARRS
eukprot:363669-Chlamydomonas_euryale.AAC.3